MRLRDIFRNESWAETERLLDMPVVVVTPRGSLYRIGYGDESNLLGRGLYGDETVEEMIADQSGGIIVTEEDFEKVLVLYLEAM